MASSTSSTSTPPSPSLDQHISPSAYITVFTLGSLVLILFITVACYTILRARRQTLDNQTSMMGSKQQQGLDEQVLGNCPKMMFSQLKIKYGDSRNSGFYCCCCSICLGNYKEVDMVLLLPNCGHFFHVKCVDKWLKLRPTCPMCRNSPILVSV